MINGTLTAGLTAQLDVRAHSLVSGLSEANGGHDEGPNPHEILEAALAACTILTVKLYANRKGIKVEKIEAKVRFLSEGQKNSIGLDLRLEGDLSVEEIARLREIATKCPIHKVLAAGSEILLS